MPRIKEEELKKYSGGGISLGLGLTIAGVIIFIVGVIDGYVRPLSCNR